MSNVRSRLQRPAVLLFDLGGVLVENVGFDRLNALLPSPIPLEELKTQWLASPAVRAFETGTCASDTFAQEVVAQWQLPLSASAFLEAFTYWPKGLYAGASGFLAGLRRHFTVACLSNSNEIHWNRFHGFSDHFDFSLSSHILGAVKPDPECFIKALEQCGTTVGQVAFFDDALANIAGARAIGMQAFHVNGLAEVRHILSRERWLSDGT